MKLTDLLHAAFGPTPRGAHRSLAAAVSSAVVLVAAAVAVAITQPPLPVAVTLVLGAWSVHRALAAGVLVIWALAGIPFADDIRSWAALAAGTLVAALLGRILAVRCVRPLASMRQATYSLLFAFAVAVPATALRLTIGGVATADDVPRRVMGTVAVITAGVVLSRWLARPRVPASTVPLGIIAITTTIMVISAEYLRYQDSDALEAAVAQVVAGLQAAHDNDLGLASALTVTSNTDPLTHDNFAQTVSAILMGNDAISAVALAEEFPTGIHVVSDSLADSGDAAATAFSQWIEEEHTEITSTSEGEDIEFAGTALLPDADGRTVPHVVHASEVAHEHGDGEPETGQHYVYVALSLPEWLQRASSSVLSGTGGAAIRLWNLDADPDTPLWTQTATDDSGAELALLGDEQLTARASLVLHGLTYTVEALPSVDFGIPHRTLQLLLISEGISGLFAFVALSIATTRRNLTEEGRRRRQAMLDAALSGSRGWAAIVDEGNQIRISNGERAGEPSSGDIAAARFWADDPAAVERLHEVLAQAREHGESGMTHTWSNPEEPGRMRFVEVRTHRLPDTSTVADPDQLCYLQCIDVTEEREQALRTAQAERMAAIGELAGGLAHDFNNLLFVALGNLQLIERRAEASGDETLLGYATRSAQAVQRGSDIARALLTVSGRYPVNESTIHLDEFVREMAALIEQSLGKEVTVEFDLSPGLVVRADPGRLSSSILNLCVNARHAMDERPVRRAVISCRPAADGTIEVAVADSGSGMSPQVAARAFEPFFSTKPRGKGTGLGLASVFSFAQQSHGTARIDTVEGEGTTVTIVLPVAADDAVPALANSTRELRTALIVDDEQNLADLVSSWLEEDGIACRVAYDAPTAFRLLEETSPDLLLTDVNLGAGQNGADIAAALRDSDPRATIIFMTGFADKVRMLQETGSTTLAKPFTADELREVIRRSGSSTAEA